MKGYVASFLDRASLVRLVKVGIVGVGNTVVSFGLFNLFLRLGMWSVAAVSLAFAVTTFLSYLVNRAWTFELRDGRVSGRETLHFYLVNLAAWAATAGTMWLAERILGPLTTLAANGVYLAVSGVILLPKFASYRDLVFGEALAAEAES
ncbi:MAG TPA: GtrA family protein [Actinobacteria bacterium]|nr:GtrA family protein [Actinomycetota bacterium]